MFKIIQNSKINSIKCYDNHWIWLYNEFVVKMVLCSSNLCEAEMEDKLESWSNRNHEVAEWKLWYYICTTSPTPTYSFNLCKRQLVFSVKKVWQWLRGERRPVSVRQLWKFPKSTHYALTMWTNSLTLVLCCLSCACVWGDLSRPDSSSDESQFRCSFVVHSRA